MTIGGEMEDQVWADIEEFGRNPGPTLDRLATKLAQKIGNADQYRAEASERERDLAAKANERDAVVRLFRQGRIDAVALDRQLDDIEREEATLRAEIDRLVSSARTVEDAQARLVSASELLAALNRRFDEPITWEVKRECVETLVREIVVKTEIIDGRAQAVPVITYVFEPIATRTDAPARSPHSAHVTRD